MTKGASRPPRLFPLPGSLVMWLGSRRPEDVPIEDARNLGPVTGGELRRLGMATLADLLALPFEECFLRIVACYPNRCNANFARAVLGARHGQDCRLLGEDLKGQAARACTAARGRR